MSRVNGLFVTFEEDVSDEYAEHISNAIRMMRNVADVSQRPTDISDHIATMRAKQVISQKLFEVLRES